MKDRSIEINVFIGLPGAGKSYYARENFDENYIYLCTDRIREEIFEYNFTDYIREKVFQEVITRIRNSIVEKSYKVGFVIDTSYFNGSRDRIRFLEELNRIQIEENISFEIIFNCFKWEFEECVKNSWNKAIERRLPRKLLEELNRELVFPKSDEYPQDIFTYRIKNIYPENIERLFPDIIFVSKIDKGDKENLYQLKEKCDALEELKGDMVSIEDLEKIGGIKIEKDRFNMGNRYILERYKGIKLTLEYEREVINTSKGDTEVDIILKDIKFEGMI